jgi:aminobenzoyl-glutamate transport protein
MVLVAGKKYDIGRQLKFLATSSIRWIERVGNYLPHPFFLFIILILVIFLLSYILNQIGVQTSYMKLDPVEKSQTLQTVEVINLFEKDILQSIIENFVGTFIYFAPV